MKAFLTALTFLTRIPLPDAWKKEEGLSGKVQLFFPAVALLIGLLSLLLAWIFEVLFSLGFVVIFLAPLLLTGALHLDGWADSADGLFHASNPRRRLAIMRDSHLGVYGVAALVVLLLLRFALSRELWSREVYAAFVLAPVFGKILILFLIRFGKRVAESGALSRHLDEGPSSKCLFFWGGFFALSVLFCGLSLSWALLVLCLPILLWAYRKIDGVSGDLCGFANELGELFFLLAAFSG
jgi:adenosylcobinamide-GDP ribazoletransferase